MKLLWSVNACRSIAHACMLVGAPENNPTGVGFYEIARLFSLTLTALTLLSLSTTTSLQRYRVEPKGKDAVEQIALLIQTQHAGQTGIVYCLSKKDTEMVADALRTNGVKAAAYTSDCTTAHRQRVQVSVWTMPQSRMRVLNQ
jgi:hypothetical protein